MVLNDKVINGKKYLTTDKFTNRMDADKEAKRLRKLGYSVRVIKEGFHYPYVVYKRKAGR